MEKISFFQLDITFFIFLSNPNIINKQLDYMSVIHIYLFPNAKDLKKISHAEIIFDINYIKNYGINFNDWIKCGINYLSEKQFKELYKNIIEKNIIYFFIFFINNIILNE